MMQKKDFPGFCTSICAAAALYDVITEVMNMKSEKKDIGLNAPDRTKAASDTAKRVVEELRPMYLENAAKKF